MYFFVKDEMTVTPVLITLMHENTPYILICPSLKGIVTAPDLPMAQPLTKYT